MSTTQTAREALEELMRRCREDQHTPTYADLQAVLARFPEPARTATTAARIEPTRVSF
jgi:hypothetical protein